MKFRFIYPPRLKEPKLILFFKVKDLGIILILTAICLKYAMSILSFIPLAIPIIYGILVVRFLENSESISMFLMLGFKYLLANQQTYFWGKVNKRN